MSVHVLAPGLATTVQDGGRRGLAASGVGAAGAMDTVALRLANRLVGNGEDAAALEITLRGPRLRVEIDCLVAIAGGDADVRCAGQRVPTWRPVALRAGAEISFDLARGARGYLAIAGGFRVDAVLGSRSVDLNAAIGPMGGRALRPGDVLPAQSVPHSLCRELWREAAPRGFAATRWSLDPAPWFDATSRPLSLVPGSHFAALDAASQHALFAADFRVGADSNRVGFRLEGPRLALATPLEPVSEATVPGTLQLPPGGAPIALMAEAPTCGGYPRIGHIATVDLPRLAQLRPHDTLRFAGISPETAQTRYLERERILTALAQTIDERLHA
ncbi:MAG TPA: biotin-dependent carboxyltransferase family protein [Rudaea sp.]|nr:biotin-dependent carboxyltransferase family protein [Rudaea sp.]